jgi:hypothetical protein
LYMLVDGVWTEQPEVKASDGADGDQYGISIAMDGDTIVVGADQHDDNGNDSGCAYVFVRMVDGWTEQVKLTASDGAAGDHFGRGVTFSNDTIVVGAWGGNTATAGDDTGSAYVYTRSKNGNWTEQMKLSASDGSGGDQFGFSVASEGDTLVIGSWWDNAMTGSVYVYSRSDSGDWTEHSKLSASDGEGGDQFGVSVAISGDTLVIGAWGFIGSAYVFTRSSQGRWVEQTKMTPSDGANGDEFGINVAIDGDTIGIGATQTGRGDSGSAYMYTRSGYLWTEQTVLTPRNGSPYDYFGRSVAIENDTVVVGAPFDDNNNGDDSGGAYVFFLQ